MPQAFKKLSPAGLVFAASAKAVARGGGVQCCLRVDNDQATALSHLAGMFGNSCDS